MHNKHLHAELYLQPVELLINTMNQAWLSRNCFQLFADVIYAKGAPSDTCWDFFDGTVRSYCRPGINQGIVYNGHKRVHNMKFKPLLTPNGLIVNLFGPGEDRKHDNGMLGYSGLCTQL